MMRSERGSELPTYVVKWTAEEVKELLTAAATLHLNKHNQTNLTWSPVGLAQSDNHGGYILHFVGVKNAQSK